jgi:hypothetical protein
MHIDEQMAMMAAANIQEAERNAETMEQLSGNPYYIFKFREIVVVKAKEWVFEKAIGLPFVPFPGLVVHELFGIKDGKKTFMPCKIEPYHRIEYMNDGEDSYFFVEHKSYTDDHEPYLKRLLSWKYVLVRQPDENK